MITEVRKFLESYVTITFFVEIDILAYSVLYSLIWT